MSFTIRVVTAQRGGTFQITAEFGVGDHYFAALDRADAIQHDIDAEAFPARAYVIAPDGVPVYAGNMPNLKRAFAA